MQGHDIATIRRALEHLPETCRYHGDQIEDTTAHLNRLRYGGACCATGEPVLARRRALAVLARVQPPLPANPLERPVF